MGGTIRTELNIAGYLAERHDVEILSVVRRRAAPFFAFPPGVKVTALDDRRPDATPPRARRVIRAALRSRSSVLMPRKTHPFPISSLWTDVRLARALHRRSGVLITTRPCLDLLAADLSPPGLITVGHAQMHLRAYHKSVRRAMARRYGRLDAVVVLTDQDARDYQTLVPGLSRLTVIPNTVRSMGGRSPANGTTMLAAGRFTPQKGFDLLIRAFAHVAAVHPDWRLRICGDGRQRRELERLVDEQGLADVVSLPGPARDLGRDMDDAAMFVLSSRFEGFPLILVEAMGKGLPIVSFDCRTGPREVIEDHRNGLLVPAGDVDALAGAMMELAADEHLRRRLAAEAARTARDYTIEALGPRWEQLLHDLAIANRDRGRAGG